MDKIDRSTSKEEAPSSGCLCILEEEMRAGKVHTESQLIYCFNKYLIIGVSFADHHGFDNFNRETRNTHVYRKGIGETQGI